MFLWIIVAVMAIALVAEIVALIAIAITVSRAVRRSMVIKNELSERLRSSIQTAQEIMQAVRPDVEKIRFNGAEIITAARAEVRLMGAAWQDFSRRSKRLRLRFGREGVATVEQLQRGRHMVSRSVVSPIRTAASVAMGLRATTWLLRKVA